MDRNIMPMSRRLISEALQLVGPKNHDRNFLSAAFHMVTISLISMSLVDLNWFMINGGECTPYITLSDFFTFGYGSDETDNPDFECISNTIANLMRIIILLSFMAIVFSLLGFFLDILGPKTNMSSFIRKYSLPSICAVLWIMAIISTSYYVAILLEDKLDKLYPKEDTSVSYGFGFYLIAATGGISLVGTFCSLILMHSPLNDNCQSDDGCLIDSDVDALDTFHSPPPPPPYNVPPPPYTP